MDSVTGAMFAFLMNNQWDVSSYFKVNSSVIVKDLNPGVILKVGRL